MEETGKNPIQVAARLFQVIELLAEHGPMGIMEISASLGFHKSTVHRLVSSLQQLGYIRQDEETMKYGLSLKFLEISGADPGADQHGVHCASVLEKAVGSNRGDGPSGPPGGDGSGLY